MAVTAAFAGQGCAIFVPKLVAKMLVRNQIIFAESSKCVCSFLSRTDSTQR